MGDELLCTDLYIEYPITYKMYKALHQHAENRPFLCQLDQGYIKPFKCQAAAEIIATASPRLSLDWCSNIS